MKMNAIKNILYLSDRQTGKTTSGLCWALNSVLFSCAEHVVYVCSSTASMKTTLDRLLKKLTQMNIKFYHKRIKEIVIVRKNGTEGTITFVTPVKEQLHGCCFDRAVLDDVDCWNCDVFDFIKNLNYCMMCFPNRQTIAFVNKAERVNVNHHSKRIEYLNDEGKPKFYLSNDEWSVAPFFNNFNTNKSTSVVLANNIWDAGDSLITEIETNSNKELEFYDKKKHVIIPVNTEAFSKYFFIERESVNFVTRIGGFHYENIKDYIKSGTNTYRTLYGVVKNDSHLYDVEVASIISFDKDDDIELRTSNGF